MKANNPREIVRVLPSDLRPLLDDFVAEVGDDKSVAAGANFLS
jgi:hypothetical protein